MVLRTVVVVVGAAALSACGSGMKLQSGKQAAAEAVYALSGPTSAPGGASSFGLGTFSASCAKGGSVGVEGFSVNVNTSGGGADVGQTLSLTYKGCTVDTKAGPLVFNGTIDVTQRVVAGGSGATVEQAFHGKMYLQGAYDDFLELNVSERVEVATGSSGGSVAVVLKGDVTDASGRYTFDEAVAVSPGTVSVQASSSAKP